MRPTQVDSTAGQHRIEGHSDRSNERRQINDRQLGSKALCRSGATFGANRMGWAVWGAERTPPKSQTAGRMGRVE